jgi:hypothetical protein
MFEQIRFLIERQNPHGLLGNYGYTLPMASEFDVYPLHTLANSNKIPQIKVTGPTSESSGIIIIHRDHNLRSVLQIRCQEWTRNSAVVINKDCTLHGDIQIYSEDCCVILIGGVPKVGHSGFLRPNCGPGEIFST